MYALQAGKYLRQHFFSSVDPSESHDVRDEVKQELEGVVAQLVLAAAVAVEHQVTPRVQGESVARHARKPHESVAVLVPSGGLEGEPKGLSVCACIRSIVCAGGDVGSGMLCVGVCRARKHRSTSIEL